MGTIIDGFDIVAFYQKLIWAIIRLFLYSGNFADYFWYYIFTLYISFYFRHFSD